MNKIIRNQYNYEETKQPSPEKSTLPSLTIPDNTLSLKKLIERHASGREVTTLTGIYQESGEYDELLAALDGMSEIEQIEYKKQLHAQTKAGLAAYQASSDQRKAEYAARNKAIEDQKIADAQAALDKL